MTSFMTTVPNKIYKAAKKKAPNAIKTPAARKGVADVENWWSRIGGGLGANMTKSTLLKNAKELARRGANVSISEGIEEGKQYLGGQQWINGEMDDREVTFGFGNNNFITNSIDLASWGDDMLNGLKSAYVMAGFPFNAELINDPELMITFGVLHCIALSLILIGLLEKVTSNKWIYLAIGLIMVSIGLYLHISPEYGNYQYYVMYLCIKLYLNKLLA